MDVTATAAPIVSSLDRVLWQRLVVDEHGTVGSLVAGTRRRRPATVRVDARTAHALVDAGLPTVTRHLG